MLLKTNKRQNSAGAFELRKESSISVRSGEIVFQSVKWKQKMSTSLWRVENVDSIPHFYLRNHVGERFYLTFKSLSGHVRCLSLKSSIKSLSDKSSKSLPTPPARVSQNSTSLVCGKHFAITFISNGPWKAEWMWLGARKGRAIHPHTGPKSSQISFNQRLNIFQSIFDIIKHFLLSFAMFSFSSSSHYKIHLWKWNRNRGTRSWVLGFCLLSWKSG